MNKPTIYPLQYFGLGDIIYTQQLIRELAGPAIHEDPPPEEAFAPIVWGVLPQFVEGLQRAYPDITWVDYHKLKIDYNCKVDKEVLVPMGPHVRGMGFGRLIPIRWADQILGLPYSDCMRAKYMLYGKSYMEWKTGAMWQRDKTRELELLNRAYKISDGGPFNLINQYYQSDNGGIRHGIIPSNQFSDVYLQPIEGYSLFDWAAVIEHAEEVHTVSTSLLYLLELLNLQSPAHLYERPTDPGFKQVQYLFTKPYILYQ